MKPSKPSKIILFAVLLLASHLTHAGYAESLFRTGVSYQANSGYTPKSLFAVPRPNSVGDIVTIKIIQTTNINQQLNSTTTRQHQLKENTSGILNGLVNKVLGVKNLLPTVDGVNNNNQISVRAQNQTVYQFNDSVSCQVVQVLPNGNLVIQGHKTILSNKESQDLYVTGVVNPFYVDASNAIESNKVANLQMNLVGKGPVTRQQGDGLVGKYMQFLD
jgi:flagellar L-ring protein FlgH